MAKTKDTISIGFEKKTERLTKSVAAFFTRSCEQEEEIHKQLESIGWEV